MAGFSFACISCDQIKTPPKWGFVSRDAVMRDTDHLPYWNHLSGKFQSVRMSHWDALSRCEVTPWGFEVFAKAHHGALWCCASALPSSPWCAATTPTSIWIYHNGKSTATLTHATPIRRRWLLLNALTCCVRGVYFPPVTVLSPRHRVFWDAEPLRARCFASVCCAVLTTRCRSNNNSTSRYSISQPYFPFIHRLAHLRQVVKPVIMFAAGVGLRVLLDKVTRESVNSSVTSA